MSLAHCSGGSVKKLRSVFILFVLLVLNPSAFSAEYGVSGTISVDLMRPDGISFTNMTFPFTAMSRGITWGARIDFGKDWHIQAGSDGTNVYRILNDPQSAEGARKPLLPAGQVSDWSYPVDEPWYVSLPWFAYCSAAFLDKYGHTNLPAPWAGLRVDPIASIFHPEIERAPSDPTLPLKASFQVKESLKLNSPIRDWLFTEFKTPESLLVLKDFPDGFVGAEYSVTSTTNFNGLSLPQAFELKSYYPDEKGGRVVGQIFRGSITQVFELPPERSLVPDFKSVSVSDFRFRDTGLGIDFIKYNLTNGTWVTEKTPELVSNFQNRQQVFKRNTEGLKAIRAKMRTKLPATLLVVIALLPLAWWSGKRWRNRKTR